MKISIYNRILDFILDLYRSREIILTLTIRDLKTKFLGSYISFLWAFFQPLVTGCVMWFVFEVGFRVAAVSDYPFILWLLSGIIPWFFISESLINGTNSILDFNYIVKKMHFRLSIPPLVKIFSASLVHIIFLCLLSFFFVLKGYSLDRYCLQVLYYYACSFLLLTSITWFTSALTVFIRDVKEIVAITVQILFWFTPIFWNINRIPPKYHIYLKLNPFFYIIQGYRESFIYKKWFWEHNYLTIYFWCLLIFFMFLGVYTFTKLKDHFADVI